MKQTQTLILNTWPLADRRYERVARVRSDESLRSGQTDVSHSDQTQAGRLRKCASWIPLARARKTRQMHPRLRLPAMNETGVS